jgi:hypothetical protein
MKHQTNAFVILYCNRKESSAMEGEFFSDRWDKDLSFFKQDVLNLKRLLHRNANQHKGTLGFSYLHRILRLLGCWKIDHLLLFRKVIVQLRGKQVQDSKVNQGLVDQLLLLAYGLSASITTSTKALTYVHKAFQVFSKKLASKVFVPLFAFIWAWLAKMFRHLRGIVLPFHEAFLHTIGQLKVSYVDVLDHFHISPPHLTPLHLK